MGKKRRPALLHSLGLTCGIAFLVLCTSAVTKAQLERPVDATQDSRVSNYRFAERSELTITVSLIGAVAQPGRYEISRSIDLMNLLALAGGWTEVADLADVHINRSTGDADRKDIRLNISDFKNISHQYLVLQHGDFVFVGAKSGLTTQDVLSYVTTAAILVTTYITIVEFNRFNR